MTEERVHVAIGLALLAFSAVLAISMLTGGRLGRWWYFGGRSRNDLDERTPIVPPVRENYRERRRRERGAP